MPLIGLVLLATPVAMICSYIYISLPHDSSGVSSKLVAAGCGGIIGTCSKAIEVMTSDSSTAILGFLGVPVHSLYFAAAGFALGVILDSTLQLRRDLISRRHVFGALWFSFLSSLIINW